MTKHKKLCDEAYFYNLWAGKLRTHRGVVWSRNETNSNCYIEILNANGVTAKILNCAGEEGLVFNKSVWLCEHDPKRAIGILIKKEEEEIAKLQFMIKNHQLAIEALSEIRDTLSFRD